MELRGLLVPATLLLWAAVGPGAAGHAMLSEPASRNVIANTDYCPMCLSAGGGWGRAWRIGRGGAAAAAERSHPGCASIRTRLWAGACLQS